MVLVNTVKLIGAPKRQSHTTISPTGRSPVIKKYKPLGEKNAIPDNTTVIKVSMYNLMEESYHEISGCQHMKMIVEKFRCVFFIQREHFPIYFFRSWTKCA